ncbi:hypothetical protein QAD02_015514 [Eretmocerus hayati]|uniref:Uncharacterized protein n=1 Tax=Eretmocerus hayati TaxID=131215 RepID=A0ACC2P8H0_9HYME|nr:hypothetical protein QAD02_015514 [Eretmocerus hayati]
MHPNGWPQHPQQRSHSQEMEYNNDENRNNVTANGYSNNDIMSRSFTCPRGYDLSHFSRDFDMSQSLIVAKTTTCTEFLQLEQFGSNSTSCHRRAESYDSQNALVSTASPPVNNSLPRNSRRQFAGRPKTPPVPPERNSPLQQQPPVQQSISPIIENFVSTSNATIKTPVEEDHLVETPNNNRAPKWPENYQQNGLPDSSCENSMRIVEDVVSADRIQRLSNITPDVANGFSTATPSPAPEEESTTTTTTTTTTTMSKTTTADKTINCQTSTSTKQKQSLVLSQHHNYENLAPLMTNGKLSVYENVTLPPANNDPYVKSLPRPPKRRDACEMIDNKLDVSNDDLLEAIEQLSMLSRPRSSGASITITCEDGSEVMGTTEMTPPTTPKRINCERDNAKSNEAKADKERRELEEEDRKKYVEFLQNEKQHILGNMDGFKRSVADIETQEDEIHRELELEKALLSAEYESESLKLEQDEAERDRVQARTAELEHELQESKAVQGQLQSEARQRVTSAQQACARLEQELAEASGRDDERDSELADRLAASSETLDTERKAFEDLEFHHLEQEASRLAAREELQRYLGELSTKIESRKLQLSQLETQRTDIQNAVTKEAKSLERQKLAHLRRLEEGRNRLRAIDDELEGLAKNVADNPDEKRSPSREDFDRISRVTTDSPIVNNQGSLGRKTIESLKEIERNRQLHLAKQGSQVISEERRRVEELKRRVQDEVRSQWEERKMNCTSFNSVESGEESSSYSTGPTESGSGSSDGADNGTTEKLSPGKLSEFTTPSPGPSGNSYTLLQSENARDDRPVSMETERFNGNGSAITDETESRPLSQTSSELESLGPLQVKHRDKPRLQRPLTRYLPIKSESLDLRYHIETAGHQLPLIHDVSVDTTSCSGYLSKMSKKFHHWNKRWFVFDRKRKMLSYFGDSNSKKPRGVIYFQSIEEVYVDHMNTVKSPQPSLTFIVKTTTRLYHLMAPSAEAMRVWVDVVFTGAEGYHEFDPNS